MHKNKTDLKIARAKMIAAALLFLKEIIAGFWGK